MRLYEALVVVAMERDKQGRMLTMGAAKKLADILRETKVWASSDEWKYGKESVGLVRTVKFDETKGTVLVEVTSEEPEKEGSVLALIYALNAGKMPVEEKHVLITENILRGAVLVWTDRPALKSAVVRIIG